MNDTATQPFSPAETDLDMLAKAYGLARRAHAKQTRRDGVTPYMTHIYAVMQRAPKDAVSQAVAIMHDLVEDHPEYWGEIRDGFPPEVVNGVYALTKGPGETYPAFIERVRDTDNGRWAAIKVADILANLSDDPTPRQIRKYAAALLVLVPVT